MEPITVFGYGIYLSRTEEFEQLLRNEFNYSAHDWYDEVQKNISEEFGCKLESWGGLGDDSPVEIKIVNVGEDEVGIFLSSNYSRWDWDDNGSRIDPKLFEVPDNAEEILQRTLKATGLSEDLAKNAKFFALNYSG